MPPRENPRVNKSLDSVHASGPLGRAHCVIHGNQQLQADRAAAGVRGVLAAAAAAASGSASPPAARRSGTASCSACCAASGWCREPRTLTRARAEPCGWSTTSTRARRSVPDAPCLTTDGADLHVRRGPGARPGGSPRRSPRRGVAAGRQGRDPVGQRPDRVHLRVRDQPGRRGVVPDQPAQRGGREPRAARPVRLLGADLPGGLRAAGRRRSAPTCRSSHTLVCLDGDAARRGRCRWDEFLGAGRGAPVDRAEPVDDLAMIVGTGGTTGRPKGVMLTGTNLETMTAITLMGYPFEGRPVYLALAPLTHAAGVLCFPVLALGGEIVIMRTPDVGAFLDAGRAAPGHAHVPAADADLHGARPRRRSTAADLSSLQCFWYGAAPMSAARLEEALTRIGPVMAQLFGQTEAPMMISTMPPADHFRADGIDRHRAALLGRAAGAAGHGRDHGRGRRAAAARRARRDRRPRLAGDGAATTRTRRPPRRRRRTAGTTPATSATSTTTTSCSSSTGPRT